MDSSKILCVMSGKGGVGKSSVTCQIALTLAAKGKRVGILDLDLCGPSIPLMMHVKGSKIVQGPKGWLPVPVTLGGDGANGSISVISLEFLLNPLKDEAVIWRGPKKTAMVQQLIQKVDWGLPKLDYLLIDTPPGTSDEHITLASLLKGSSYEAILVTTPQTISLIDVEREIGFCQQTGPIPIKGIIENMAGYLCGGCNVVHRVFGSGGGEIIARKHSIPLLASLPIQGGLAEIFSKGGDLSTYYCSEQLKDLRDIFSKIDF